MINTKNITRRSIIIATGIVIVILLLFSLFYFGRKQEEDLLEEDFFIDPPSFFHEIINGEEDERKNGVEQETVRGKKEERRNPETGEVYDVITYIGTGSQKIGVEKPEEGRAMFYIKGNEDGKHFVVTGYEIRSSYFGGSFTTRLFVNTFGEYEGTVLDPEGRTNMLEIKGEGSWKIEVRSVNSARGIDASGAVSGKGSEVIQIKEGAKEATIIGNLDAQNTPKNFEVNVYNSHSDTVVRTSSVYMGTVQIPSSAVLLEIITDDEWEISLE